MTQFTIVTPDGSAKVSIMVEMDKSLKDAFIGQKTVIGEKQMEHILQSIIGEKFESLGGTAE